MDFELYPRLPGHSTSWNRPAGLWGLREALVEEFIFRSVGRPLWQNFWVHSSGAQSLDLSDPLLCG